MYSVNLGKDIVLKVNDYNTIEIVQTDCLNDKDVICLNEESQEKLYQELTQILLRNQKNRLLNRLNKEREWLILKNNILNKFNKSEWFDFSNGFKISEETVNSWIEEGIEFLENNKDREFYCSGSGNTLVFITRDENDYCINVCDRYKELNLYRKND